MIAWWIGMILFAFGVLIGCVFMAACAMGGMDDDRAGRD